jgi:DNA-binding transcriptional regulator YhcF (GntR family)
VDKREFIILALKHGLSDLLNKKKCDIVLNELYQQGVIELHAGKFVIVKEVTNLKPLSEVVDEYNKLFYHSNTGTAGRTGNKDVIQKKVVRFSKETGLTYSQILELAKYYTTNYRILTKYLISANNFLYKKVGLEENSYAKQLLGEQELEDEFNNNFTELM